MEMRLSRKGFAFSLLVFFISIVLFAYLYFDMSKNDFTKDSMFVDSRINSLNNEIVYFKDSYFRSVLSYSFYNTVFSLMNYTRDPLNYHEINQNYTKLNQLIYEGMIYGSFDGDSQDYLLGISDGDNKTVSYFVREYVDTFNQNYRANFTMDIMSIYIYETKPYYLEIEVLINYSITTIDNLSTWSNIESMTVGVPVFNLPHPQFLIYENITVPIKTAEYSLTDKNWSMTNFQKTINESYTSVFFHEDYKYSVGNSFLKNYLNISYSSYSGVMGFWSFDYDEDEKQVYDTSGYNLGGVHYGSSIGVYNFNNNTLSGGNYLNLADLSSYPINVFQANCNSLGIKNSSCLFDGVNDYLYLNNFKHINNQVSVFSWVKFENIGAVGSAIVCAQNQYFCFYINSDYTISVRLNGTTYLGGASNEIKFTDVNITSKNWHFVGFVYDGLTTTLYLDGIRYFESSSISNSNSYSNNLAPVNGNLYIGKTPTNTKYFNGSIDEVGIYNRALKIDEIAYLYESREAKLIDYKNTYFEKGIEFDGIDDYVLINSYIELENLSRGDFSIEMWFKPYNVSKFNLFIYEGEIALAYNQSGFYFRDNNGNPDTPIPYLLKEDKYYYLVAVRDNFLDRNHIYVNGEYFGNINTTSWAPDLDGGNILIGGGPTSGPVNSNFSGIIDEVKIYNRILSKEEISNNYLSYDSLGKGCCNYFVLVDPEKFGYNNSLYKKDISYSTKLFYDYHIRNLSYNITLFNLTFVTSNDPSTKYYNFLFDDCVQHNFRVATYQSEAPGIIELDLYKHDAIDNASCANLIKYGIY